MIFVILGVAIALLCYRMGIYIGRRMAEQEFEYMRQEMGLYKEGDENGDGA